jgi:hypothetical protein
VKREWTILAVVIGLLFGLEAVLLVAEPAYWDPTDALDWLAVITWALALLSLAPGTWLIVALSGPPPLAPTRLVATAGSLVVAALVMAGIGTLLEHAFDLEVGALLYLVGELAGALGLLGLTVALALARRRWLGLLTLATLLGVALQPIGGLFLVALAWLAFANGAQRIASAAADAGAAGAPGPPPAG